MARNLKNISETWAYDIDKNPVNVGEIWDKDVINQSIELILGTIPGERLFNPSFGYGLQTKIFDLFSPDEAENMLDEIAAVIKRWEDRIVLLESDMRVIADVDQHYVILVIPYIIRRNGIKSVFKKKIVSG